jgi:DNA-directed RNA polymerase specialized sigma24 family protein
MTEKTPYDDYAMTQQEVADVLGMKRSYVGFVETRAKAKLKAELEKRGYKLEDFLGGMA